MTTAASLDLVDELRMIPKGRTREAVYAFAYAMLQAEQLEPAMKAFRVLVRYAPTDERAWLGLGACHEKLGEVDVAAELYGAGAMVASPPSARCRLALARIARGNGDPNVALDHVETASALVEPDDDELAALVDDERQRACTQ